MQCQHLPGVGRRGEERVIPKKGRSRTRSRLSQALMCPTAPAQRGQEVLARAGVDSSQVSPSGPPPCRGSDGCRRRVLVAPTTGGFRFQVPGFKSPVAVLPPAPARTERGIAACGPDALRCGAQPAAEPPPAWLTAASRSSHVLFPSKAGLRFHCNLHCSTTASSAALPSPYPQPPVATGSQSVASTWELAEATAFAQGGCFTPPRGGYRGSRLFPLGAIVGSSTRRWQVPGDGGALGKGCWLCLSQGKGQKAGRKKTRGSVQLRPQKPRWHQQNFPWKWVALGDNTSPLVCPRGALSPCPLVAVWSPQGPQATHHIDGMGYWCPVLGMSSYGIQNRHHPTAGVRSSSRRSCGPTADPAIVLLPVPIPACPSGAYFSWQPPGRNVSLLPSESGGRNCWNSDRLSNSANFIL